MPKRVRKSNTYMEAEIDAIGSISQFCPICQIPFSCLKIQPFVHTIRCEVNWNDLSECNDGVKCCNNNIFHYRDFAHSILAEYRLNNYQTGIKKESYKELTNIFDEKCSSTVIEDTDKCDDNEDNIFVTKPMKKWRTTDTKYFMFNTRESNKMNSINSACIVTNNAQESNEPNSVNRICPVKNNIKSEITYEKCSDLNLEKDKLANNKLLPIDLGRNDKCKGEWKLLLKGEQKLNSHPNNTESKIKQKICPSYKRIPETRFVVDAFQYGAIEGISTYFLSHFHYDHYIGLKKSFSLPLYCTKITANLVKKKIKVCEKYIHLLECKKPIIVENAEITPLDANHCPGSVILLFRLSNGKQYLHTGDFRANSLMEEEPILMQCCITALFLDTTYCDPEYTFPTQAKVIDRVRSIVTEKIKLYPRSLFICGSYTIGKERVFLGIMEELKCKLWADRSKRDVFNCLDEYVPSSSIVDEPLDAKVHILPMCKIKFTELKIHLSRLSGKFSHIFAFRPSGWEMTNCVNDLINCSMVDNITIYGVPYSEHSSFAELCQFVKFIKPAKVIPTVNLGNRSMHAILKSTVDSYSTQPKQSTIDSFISKVNVSFSSSDNKCVFVK